MKVKLKKITVKELVKDYSEGGEDGVFGYGGKLDIRPPYQREFVYKDKQRDAVIDTITRNFPLNVMYWAVRDDGTFEIIDGQQRTISVAQYVHGIFSHDELYFHNLPSDKQDHILNYRLMIYVCSGEDSEKLEWFRTVNIAGEKLTDQELRNAVYAGSWVSDAKRHFSRNGCAAHGMGKDYLSGSSIRQDYLETAIKWISDDNIEEYMGKRQHKANAKDLWNHFQSVINWVEATFTHKRTPMKGVDWGSLYNEYKNKKLNPVKIEKETERLFLDDDVSNRSGIYPYILTRDEKHLNIRVFSDAMKQKQYQKQGGICVECKEKFELAQMEADHITPWVEGGKTDEANCQMLCRECNRRKSSK